MKLQWATYLELYQHCALCWFGEKDAFTAWYNIILLIFHKVEWRYLAHSILWETKKRWKVRSFFSIVGSNSNLKARNDGNDTVYVVAAIYQLNLTKWIFGHLLKFSSWQNLNELNEPSIVLRVLAWESWNSMIAIHEATHPRWSKHMLKNWSVCSNHPLGSHSLIGLLLFV